MYTRRTVGPISVQPEWCHGLPLQQQSVLLLASRGPDGFGKYHPCKRVHVAYRGTVLLAGRFGRPLKWGEHSDGFMSLQEFADDFLWPAAIDGFFRTWDELPQHYLSHLAHGAEIIGYKHPDERFRDRWRAFYARFVTEMHLAPESEAEMDVRLGDWDREGWA